MRTIVRFSPLRSCTPCGWPAYWHLSPRCVTHKDSSPQPAEPSSRSPAQICKALNGPVGNIADVVVDPAGNAYLSDADSAIVLRVAPGRLGYRLHRHRYSCIFWRRRPGCARVSPSSTPPRAGSCGKSLHRNSPSDRGGSAACGSDIRLLLMLRAQGSRQSLAQFVDTMFFRR